MCFIVDVNSGAVEVWHGGRGSESRVRIYIKTTDLRYIPDRQSEDTFALVVRWYGSGIIWSLNFYLPDHNQVDWDINSILVCCNFVLAPRMFCS